MTAGGGSTPTRDDGGEILWVPPAERAAATAMARFLRWVAEREGVPEDYQAVWAWSTRPGSGFWAALAEFFEVASDGDWTVERTPGVDELSGADWFPQVQLNYAEHALRGDDARGPALVQLSEDRDPVDVSWVELRGRVGAFAAALRAWGVRPGDRVVGYLPNLVETVVALLGSAAVGAVWACCAPDYGTDAVIDRLAQIEPKVLVAADGYRFAGRPVDRTEEIEQIVAGLPSLERVVVVPRLRAAVGLDVAVPVVPWADVAATPAEPVFERVPFDHPLWILYSSGTTGLPKGIVHSQGGIVLEHLKWLGLHDDVRAGDRFFWFTSTAWMVWNASVSALLLGATVVLYDGAPNRPGADRLWELTAQSRATQFGTSAGYLTASQKAGLTPGRDHDLSALRTVLYSGSVLPVDGWRWVYEAVKGDVWLDAPCGGTDVCTPYVGGNPLSPVHAGEMQCRFLGTRVESWDEEGRHATDRIGELVVTAAMPSMPVRFWNDPDGSRFREAYFDVYPGVWRHGDWITITSRGTATVHGRSDSTINRHGVRMGSADIYAAVDRIPEVTDSLVIGAELGAGDYWMPLFVTLAQGQVLDAALRARIADEIRRSCSARHVPDEILQAPAIPHTLTGKRLEVPVKRLLQGFEPARAVNAGVVDTPEVLQWFTELGARRRAGTADPDPAGERVRAPADGSS
ncbi:acetoacetate--CoA ligase [Pseudonocardia sp. NPDC049635]|uniref:acetoacetate--CoA ligase n=1 Tax=Pseudonocardia sp. NPDC049635 TaxID=3155506 RepID=UPI0033D1BF06